MSGEWLLTPTSAFFTMWRALQKQGITPGTRKNWAFYSNRTLTPDGKAKKQLKYVNRDVYRLRRCGDYRIFYTFRDPYVSLLKLDRRDDDIIRG